jgi:rubrerythrin
VELTTFSMVLRYTLQLEDQTAQFYRRLAANNKLTQAKELFTKFANDSDRRRKDLERTARESVDHSLLEPVSGLFEETHTINTAIPNEASITDAISAAKALEDKMQKFYIEAGDKINFISNVSRLYKRYAQDKTKALASLQDFLN